MSFADEVRQWAEETKRKNRRIFANSVSAVGGSITEGSAVTGAPGQPVDTSNLLNSWQSTFPEPLVGLVVTNVSYAEAVENGEVESHTRAAHTRRAHTRSDGTEVAAHSVREHEVEGYEMTFQSSVGGAHSVKLTRQSFDLLVEEVVREELT